jgi:hypothetical protein
MALGNTLLNIVVDADGDIAKIVDGYFMHRFDPEQVKVVVDALNGLTRALEALRAEPKTEDKDRP